MKLYLCGGGSGKQIIDALSKFSKELDKTKPILYIPLAMNKEKYDGCSNSVFHIYVNGDIHNELYDASI